MVENEEQLIDTSTREVKQFRVNTFLQNQVWTVVRKRKLNEKL